MKVWVDGIPVEVDIGGWLAGFARGFAPWLGVDGGGADVVVDHVDEELVGLGGWMLVHPGAEPWTEELVGLGRVDFGEGFVEVLLGFGVEAVEAGLVHMLAVLGRGSDEEVEELGSACLGGVGIAFVGGLEDFAEMAQRGPLLRGEEGCVGLGYGIGDERGHGQWLDFHEAAHPRDGAGGCSGWRRHRGFLRQHGLGGYGCCQHSSDKVSPLHDGYRSPLAGLSNGNDGFQCVCPIFAVPFGRFEFLNIPA